VAAAWRSRVEPERPPWVLTLEVTPASIASEASEPTDARPELEPVSAEDAPPPEPVVLEEPPPEETLVEEPSLDPPDAPEPYDAETFAGLAHASVSAGRPRAEPPALPAPPRPVPARPVASLASAASSQVEGAAADAGNRPPVYPPESRARREQGIVVLRLDVDADGRVTRVEVLASSGFPRLDEAARAAAQGWRFRPARRGGRGVASSIRQRVRFTLDPS
jgi:protein TonB